MARLTPSPGGYEPQEPLSSQAQYEVRIEEAEFIKSRRKGTDGLRLKFSIVDGPDLLSGESPIGRTITDTLWLPSKEQSDGGTFLQSMVDRFLISFGHEGEEIEDASDLVGSEGKITIRNEEDAAGDPMARINKFVVPKS